MFFKVQVFQGPGFQGPGSGSRVQFQGPGPGYKSNPKKVKLLSEWKCPEAVVRAFMRILRNF